MAHCLLECSEVSRVSRLSLDTDGTYQGQGTDEDNAYGVIWWTLAGRSASWSRGDVAQEPLLPLIYWLWDRKITMQAHKHVGTISLRMSYWDLPLPLSSARRHSTTPNTKMFPNPKPPNLRRVLRMISGEVTVMEVAPKAQLSVQSFKQEHTVVISGVGKNVCQSFNERKYLQVWKSTGAVIHQEFSHGLSKWKRKFTKPCITQDSVLSDTVKTPCP